MSFLGEPLSILALGLFNGFALCVFVLSLPPLRRPTLSSRIAPYLRDQESLVDIYAPPTPRTEGFWGLVQSWLIGSTLWVTSRITTDATLRLRIDRLGGNATIERFRISQVLSILVGMIVAGGLAGALSAQRGFPPHRHRRPRHQRRHRRARLQRLATQPSHRPPRIPRPRRIPHRRRAPRTVHHRR